MNDDRRTKAQIVAELASANKTIVELQTRIAPQPQAVPEASALAGCIRALDAIPAERSNGYSSISDKAPSPSAVRNVLEHLMRRYRVDLTVHTTEPCARVHLDDADDAVLIDRLRGRF